jgi:hypothetical protein
MAREKTPGFPVMKLMKKAGNRKDAQNGRINSGKKGIACFSSRSWRLPGKPLYSFMVTFLSTAGE